jgi:hypothetical protein
MGNCILTEYVGNIDNENLLKYGEFSIEVASTNGAKKKIFAIYLRNTTISCELRVIGNGVFTASDGTEIGKTVDVVSLLPSHDIYLKSTENVKIGIMGKYSNNISGLTGIDGVTAKSEDFAFLTFYDLTGSGSQTFIFTGDLADFSIQHSFVGKWQSGNSTSGRIVEFFEKFDKTQSNIRCSIVTTKDIPKFSTSLLDDVERTTLNAISFSRGDLFNGNIEKLGYFNLADFFTPSAFAGGYTGTIEGMVTNLLTHKPSGGRIRFAFPQYYVNVTYKGESLATQSEVIKQESSYINFDAQGNITWTAS